MQSSGERKMPSGEAVTGPPQIARVKRIVLAACMTCPLCKKLLRDATTISECLHTCEPLFLFPISIHGIRISFAFDFVFILNAVSFDFLAWIVCGVCRKCIFDKLTDEEEECCPICHTDLGCAPVEKLRPDHSLQDVRSKIFPYKRRKVYGPEVVPTVSLPVRRKERSLSSLGVNAPRIGAQSGLTGRRTKAATRRASISRGPSHIAGEPKKNLEDDNFENLADSSSPEKFIKMTHCRRQTLSNTEASGHAYCNNSENGPEISMDKSELWKPLNCLVEAANRTKGFKSSLQTSAIKAEQTNCLENENHIYRSKIREHSRKAIYLFHSYRNTLSRSSILQVRQRWKLHAAANWSIPPFPCMTSLNSGSANDPLKGFRLQWALLPRIL